MHLYCLWGFFVALWFGMHYSVSFLVLQPSRKREKELVNLLLFYFVCLATVNILWLFFTVPWGGGLTVCDFGIS